jgi:hypothetical protein
VLVGTDRRGPPVRHRGARARAGLSGPVWAEIGFPFSRDFLIAFLFIFLEVFNLNSNQVSNSNQIKYMQQFKEYLGSIWCNIPWLISFEQNKINNPSLIQLTLIKRKREGEARERESRVR